MDYKECIGKYATMKGKLSPGYMRAGAVNKLVFSMPMGEGDKKMTMFISISPEDVAFDLTNIDYSKTYVLSGTLTGRDTIDAEYLRLAAVQNW